MYMEGGYLPSDMAKLSFIMVYLPSIMVTSLPIKKIVSTSPKRMSYRTPRHGYLPQSWLTSYAWSWFICPQLCHFLAIMPVLPSVMVVYSKSHGIFAKNQVISLSLVFLPKIMVNLHSDMATLSFIMVYLTSILSFSCNHCCFAQNHVISLSHSCLL